MLFASLNQSLPKQLFLNINPVIHEMLLDTSGSTMDSQCGKKHPFIQSIKEACQIMRLNEKGGKKKNI
jgi:hypothetical protein